MKQSSNKVILNIIKDFSKDSDRNLPKIHIALSNKTFSSLVLVFSLSLLW